MSICNPMEQNQHDYIIKKLAEELRSLGHIVKTNPGQEKNYSITIRGATVWPDVFVYHGGTITQIYEVETAQTTNEGSVNQWKTYSNGAYEFYLVVPETSLQTARNLVSSFGINVSKFWTF